MKITFDPQADALYIQFQKNHVSKTIKVRDGILIDIDKTGHLFGIEILDVSHRIPKKSIGRVDVNMPVEVAP